MRPMLPTDRLARASRSVLDRLRDLGRRVGDALDTLTQPQRRPAPIPVPVHEPVMRRRRSS